MDELSIDPTEVRWHSRRLGEAGSVGGDHYRYITPDFLPTALGHTFSEQAGAIAELITQLHQHGQNLMRTACEQAEGIEREIDGIEEIDHQQAQWFHSQSPLMKEGTE